MKAERQWPERPGWKQVLVSGQQASSLRWARAAEQCGCPSASSQASVGALAEEQWLRRGMASIRQGEEERSQESPKWKLEYRTTQALCWPGRPAAEELALEQAEVYLAYFRCRQVPGQVLASEVFVGQAVQSAWAGCWGRRRLEEVAHRSLGQAAEVHTEEACRTQAVAERSHPYRHNQGRRPGCLGNHEVHPVLGSELVAGIEEAAGLEENRREECRVAAAGQAGVGIAAAAGLEPAVGEGASTAIVVSQVPV